MSKFKVGDRVRCVDPVGKLIKDKAYIVASIALGANSLLTVSAKPTSAYMFERFELVTDTPRPDQLQWLKARIEEGYGNTGYNAALMDVLRIFHGITATPTTITRTEYTFSSVQP